MISQEELEKAKDTMAEGISFTRKLFDNKPSDQLHSTLDEYPEISPEIWLDTLNELKIPSS